VNDPPWTVSRFVTRRQTNAQSSVKRTTHPACRASASASSGPRSFPSQIEVGT